MNYRKEIVTQADLMFGLGGKKVLEIGSDHLLEAAGYLIEAGASSVTASNVPEEWANKQPKDQRIRCAKYDVRADFALQDRDFDVIIGIAVLEHIREMESAVRGMVRLLKPSTGRLFLEGCPIWDSPKGHHLWVDGTRPYRFNDPEANPIPDWGHLFPEEELKAKISGMVPDQDINPILDWTYRSRAINRSDTKSLIKAFRNSGARISYLEQRSYGLYPSEDLELTRGASHVADLRVVLQQ